jgi:chemotaxis protein CheC
VVLTEHQQDSLAELINIAFSRTAASLSDLIGQRVLLDAPRLELRPLDDLVLMLDSRVHEGDIATIHQIFSGPMAGDALLMLNYPDAVVLTNLLTNVPSQTSRLDTSAREVLTEVGNILLNSSLGVFGNLLQVHITFTVPRLHVEPLDMLLDSIVLVGDEARYALVIVTSFSLRDSSVRGYLVLVLGVRSLDSLIQSVDTLG